MPLLRPEAYFDRHPNPLPAGLGVFALHVVGTIVLVYAAVSLLLARIENAPAALESAMYDAMGTVVVISLVIFVVALLVVAGIMHHLVGGSDTDGTFGDAIAVAGWSYSPEVVSLPVDYLLMRREFDRLSFDGSDPAVLQSQLEAAQDPTGLGSTIVLLLTVAWSVYILAKGTAGTHDVDVRTALGPAVVVSLGSLVLALL